MLCTINIFTNTATLMHKMGERAVWFPLTSLPDYIQILLRLLVADLSSPFYLVISYLGSLPYLCSVPRMKPWLHFLSVKRELPKYEIIFSI